MFKEVKGLETIVSLLDGIGDEDVKGAFFICFRLLSELEIDLLGEMLELGVVNMMIEELDFIHNPYC
jgi:hypothetical protein